MSGLKMVLNNLTKLQFHLTPINYKKTQNEFIKNLEEKFIIIKKLN